MSGAVEYSVVIPGSAVLDMISSWQSFAGNDNEGDDDGDVVR